MAEQRPKDITLENFPYNPDWTPEDMMKAVQKVLAEMARHMSTDKGEDIASEIDLRKLTGSSR